MCEYFQPQLDDGIAAARQAVEHWGECHQDNQAWCNQNSTVIILKYLTCFPKHSPNNNGRVIALKRFYSTQVDSTDLGISGNPKSVLSSLSIVMSWYQRQIHFICPWNLNLKCQNAYGSHLCIQETQTFKKISECISNKAKDGKLLSIDGAAAALANDRRVSQLPCL